MSIRRTQWCICGAAIIVVILACTPVTAGGTGKLAVPGISPWIIGGTLDDQITYLCPTSDGGSIGIGTSFSTDFDMTGVPNHGGGDVWVIKFDPNYNIQWMRCYGGSGLDQGAWIAPTSYGGYIVLATTHSSDGGVNGYKGSGDIWVLGLNASGGIDWNGCYGGSGSDEGSFILEPVQGGYLLAGVTRSLNGDVTGYYGGDDSWVVKMDSWGRIQWEKSYGGSGNDTIKAIVPSWNNSYILAGTTSSNDYDAQHSSSGSKDIWLVNINEDGVVQWNKCFGGTGEDILESFKPTSDGGFIFVGSTRSNDGDVFGKHGGSDVWVVKLNNWLDIQWQRCLGGSGDDTGKSILQNPDGSYILTGSTASMNCDVSGIHGGEESILDAWVVKLDPNGNITWQKCIGGSGPDRGESILRTSDGGYIIAAATCSNNGDVPIHHGTGSVADTMLVKFNGPPSLNGIAPVKVTAGTRPNFTLTGENLVQHTYDQFGTEYTWPPLDVRFINTAADANIVCYTSDYSPDGRMLVIQPYPESFVGPGLYTIRLACGDGQYVILPNAVTVVCGPTPTVTSITPLVAVQGQNLTSALIKGTNFYTLGRLTAKLNRTGQPDIPGMNYVYVSTTQFRCDFQIPASAGTGKWNLVVTNPDGQYAMKKDAFTVNARTFKPPRVSSVTPKTITAGSTVFINGIAGSFFNTSAKVAMTGPKGVSIPISNVTVLSDTKITCDANLTTIPKGYATVTVTNPDGKKSSRARAFVIR